MGKLVPTIYCRTFVLLRFCSLFSRLVGLPAAWSGWRTITQVWQEEFRRRRYDLDTIGLKWSVSNGGSLCLQHNRLFARPHFLTFHKWAIWVWTVRSEAGYFESGFVLSAFCFKKPMPSIKTFDDILVSSGCLKNPFSYLYLEYKRRREKIHGELL